MNTITSDFGSTTSIVRIAQFPFVLGRNKVCNLRLCDGFVSRQHCQFILREDAVWLEDLGSRNGTYLNDEELLEPREILSGDRLRIGSHTYRCLHDHCVTGEQTLSIVPL